jgi:hypothetical protein
VVATEKFNFLAELFLEVLQPTTYTAMPCLYFHTLLIVGQLWANLVDKQAMSFAMDP